MDLRQHAQNRLLDADFLAHDYKRRVDRAVRMNRAATFTLALLSSGAVATAVFAKVQWLQPVAALAAVALSLWQTHFVSKDDIVALSSVYGEWLAISAEWERLIRDIDQSDGSAARTRDLTGRSDRLDERLVANLRASARFASLSDKEAQRIQRDVCLAHGLEQPAGGAA